MKKYFFMLSLLVFASIFTGCKKDEDPTVELKPTIEFIAGEDFITANKTVEINSEAKFKILLKSNSESDSKLTTLTIRPVYNNAPVENGTKVIELNEKNITVEYTYTMANEGQTNFTFELADKKEQKATASIIVTAEKPVVGVPVTKTSDIALGSSESTLPSFYSTLDAKGYKISDAKENAEKIDFCFLYGATKKYTIASMNLDYVADYYNGIKDWNKRNTTKFAVVSDMDEAKFDAIGETYIFPENIDFNLEALENMDKDSTPIFYYIQTEAGKKGLMKIAKLFDPTRAGKNEVHFDIIMEN